MMKAHAYMRDILRRPYCVTNDWMHDKHLGTDRVLYGSVVFKLIHETMPKATAQENLNDLVALLKTEYGRRNVPYNKRYAGIKMSMINTSGGSVKLKGKAAEIRYVGGPLHTIWCRYSFNTMRVAPSPPDKHACTCTAKCTCATR